MFRDVNKFFFSQRLEIKGVPLSLQKYINNFFFQNEILMTQTMCRDKDRLHVVINEEKKSIYL